MEAAIIAIFQLAVSLYKRWEEGNEQEKEAAAAEARAAVQAASNERLQTEEAHKELWSTGQGADTSTGPKFDPRPVIVPKPEGGENQ